MSSLDVPALRQAIKIEPRNSTAHYRLGEILRLTLQDDDGAAEEFQTVLVQDPRNCPALLSYAESERARLELAHASALRQLAASCAPLDSPFQVAVANVLFVAGDNTRALNVLRKNIAGSMHWRDPSFEAAWRSGISLDEYLSLAGRDQAAYNTAFGILLNHNAISKLSPAIRTAKELAISIDPPFLLLAVDALIGANRYDEALAPWQMFALSDAAHSQYTINTDAPVTNGAFTSKPLNQGFDWRLISVPGISSTALQKGGLDLHLDHVSGNSLGLEQAVPLLPGQQYELSAKYQSSVLSAENLRLELQDRERARVLGYVELQSGDHVTATRIKVPPEVHGAMLVLTKPSPEIVADGTLNIFSVGMKKVN